MTDNDLSTTEIAELVEREIASIRDPLVREALIAQLVAPELHMREWDYSASDERFPCWTVVKYDGSDSAIVHSQHGHGSHSPWGLVSRSNLSFGMDSEWFLRLEDAFVSRRECAALRIWNVAGPIGEIVSADCTLDEAFALRGRIDAGHEKPVHHVVYRSRPDGVR